MSIIGVDQVSNIKYDLHRAAAICINRCGLFGSLKESIAGANGTGNEALKLSQVEAEECLGKIL